MRALLLIQLLILLAPMLAGQPGLHRLNLTAHEAHGPLVIDLTSEDVAVSDDGKPQQIAFFLPWGTTHAAKAAALAAGEFSNRSRELPHVTAVVLDLLDNDVQRLQVTGALRAIERSERQDEVYLYGISSERGALLPIHALPASAGEWTAKFKPWVQDVDDGMPALLARRQPASLAALEPASFSALESLARSMAIVPGRKSVLWIGQLPLLTRRAYWGKTTAGDAAADRMAGLLRLLDAADAEVSVVRTTRTETATSTVGEMLPIPGSSPGLVEATGGRSHLDEIDKAIRAAIEDTHGGYRLFYAPVGTASAFHKIKVTSGRRGVSLTAEQSYDAGLRAQPRTVREMMNALAESWFDAAEVGLRAAVISAAAGKMHLELRIDPADLLFVNGRARFSIQIVDYSADGRILAGEDAKTIELKREPVQLPMEITFNGSVRQVRVMVCDQATQLAGTLTIPIAPGTK